MSDEQNEKLLSIDELNQYLTASEGFSFTIKEKGAEIKISMKSLTTKDMASINKILMKRSEGKAAETTVYADELRLVKISYAITEIAVTKDGKTVKFDVADKIGLEEYLRGLDDAIVKALSFKYELETAKINSKIEEINDVEDDDEVKKT